MSSDLFATACLCVDHIDLADFKIHGPIRNIFTLRVMSRASYGCRDEEDPVSGIRGLQSTSEELTCGQTSQDVSVRDASKPLRFISPQAARCS